MASTSVPFTVVTIEDKTQPARALAAALKTGCTHLMFVDKPAPTDPQHIQPVLAEAQQWPDCLILGILQHPTDDSRPSQSISKRLSHLMVWLECGVHTGDNNHAICIFPADFVRWIGPAKIQNVFNVETIVRSAWAGCSIRLVTIPASHAADSHHPNSRPMPPTFVQILRSIITHARLLIRTMLPWPHRHWPHRTAPVRETGKQIGLEVLRWLSPREAWRQLRQEHSGRTTLALGLAVGSFIANLPCFGFQTLLSLYTARRLHLHPLAVVVGSQASTPPIGVVMVAAAIAIGHLVLRGTWLTMPPIKDIGTSLASLGPWLLLDWFVGSLIVGTVMACAVFALAIALFRFIRPSNDNERVP